jgi:hypothetical protein
MFHYGLFTEGRLRYYNTFSTAPPVTGYATLADSPEVLMATTGTEDGVITIDVGPQLGAEIAPTPT